MLCFVSLETPSNIFAYNTSSSSINVTWDTILPVDQGNFYSVSGYRVSFREHSLNQEVKNVLCSSPYYYSVELSYLKVFTNYCIEIVSFTTNSVSNRSKCLSTITDEEGT